MLGSKLREVTITEPTPKLTQNVAQNGVDLDEVDKALPTTKELFLCAKDSPTEVLTKIVSYLPSVEKRAKREEIAQELSDRSFTNKCR